MACNRKVIDSLGRRSDTPIASILDSTVADGAQVIVEGRRGRQYSSLGDQ